MKQVLLKTIVIVVGKLTRSRVLRCGAGLCGAPRGRDKVRQNHTGWGRRPHPLDPPYPTSLPSLAIIVVESIYRLVICLTFMTLFIREVTLH